MIEISEILYRWSKGFKIKEIARSLGYARNSVKSVIRQAEALDLKLTSDSDQIDNVALVINSARYESKSQDKQPVIASNLADYDQRIEAWLGEKSMTITQIYRLIEGTGYKISQTSLRRYIHSKFSSLIKPGRNYTIPLVSKPGQEAQVDYGYVGLMRDPATGNQRKTYAFVMTLSYSRYRYVEFTFKQDVKSWVECHINAFKFFGGVPRNVLLDNLKSGVIKADIYDPTINKTYSELERFYNFVIDPAKVRKPEHKGKVERSVLIVKQQLIAGRVYRDLMEANEAATDWCTNIIAKKITRTTGKTPEELFILEKADLLKLPEASFDISEWITAKVHRDHHIVFKGNFYSVATKYIGNVVAVKGGFRTVEIYHDHKLIKTHLKLTGKGQFQSDPTDYPEHVLKFLEATPEKCQEEAKLIGEAAGLIVEHILKKPSKQNVRKVRAIIRLQEKYGKERVEQACFKSFIYNNYSYKAIANMLDKNLEQMSIEDSREIIYAGDYQGAYLRTANQYIGTMEAHYG